MKESLLKLSKRLLHLQSRRKSVYLPPSTVINILVRESFENMSSNSSIYSQNKQRAEAGKRRNLLAP